MTVSTATTRITPTNKQNAKPQLVAGNKVRLERARVLRALRQSKMTLEQVLDHEAVQGCTLDKLGRSIPIRAQLLGTPLNHTKPSTLISKKVLKVYREAGITVPNNRRVKNLTHRQRKMLIESLDNRPTM
jgi:hypothetical protein